MRFGISRGPVVEARRSRVHAREDAPTAILLDVAEGDGDLLRPALNFIANQGTPVYVDFRDDRLPRGAEGEMAQWMRRGVRLDDRFVLVTTQGGLGSRWVPWQLALAEGALGLENVAVLTVEDYGSFRGSPLVDLYPTIQREGEEWRVVPPDGRGGPSLRHWLAP